MKRDRKPGGGATDGRLALGRKAERLCRLRLRLAGWKILDSNWRTSFGELDLVGIQGRTLVFLEVKAFGPGPPDRPGPERPALAVDTAKQRRLARLAEAWLATHGTGSRLPDRVRDIRFDVIGVVFGRGGRAIGWEHLEDAFVLPDRQL